MTEQTNNKTEERKNRFSGETGPCCWLQWNKDTGRLTEIANPKSKDSDDFKEVNDGFQV